MFSSFIELYAETFDPDLSIFAKGYKQIVPMNLIINIQKVGTLFVMLALMIYFNNFSVGAWIYLALHGSYGKIFI